MSDNVIKFDGASQDGNDSPIYLRNGSNILDGGETVKDLSNDDLRHYSSILSAKSYRDTIRHCEILYYIYRKAEYAKWKNPYTGEYYKTFGEYSEYELHKSRRTANYLVNIWMWFGIEIGSDKVLDKFKDISWAKLKELIEVVNEDNMEEWHDKAHNMTTVELVEACREELEKKKGVKPKKGKPKKNVSDLKNFSTKLTQDQMDIIKEALSIAKDISESDNRPELLALIAQDFVGSNVFKTGNVNRSALVNYLKRLESNLPYIRLIAINSKDNSMIYGDLEDEGNNEQS